MAKLADAVRVTIGPKGRYVGITKKGERHPNVSNDGATVAAHVGAYDHVEKMGLQVVREAATAANNEAGDGTSTATLLADAIVREGVRYVTAGNDPLALRRGIQKAADVASDELLKAATQVTTRETDGRDRHRFLGRSRDRREDRRGPGRDRPGRRHLR